MTIETGACESCGAFVTRRVGYHLRFIDDYYEPALMCGGCEWFTLLEDAPRDLDPFDDWEFFRKFEGWDEARYFEHLSDRRQPRV